MKCVGNMARTKHALKNWDISHQFMSVLPQDNLNISHQFMSVLPQDNLNMGIFNQKV